MDGLLSIGKVLTSAHAKRYRVEKLLGAGGQGEVYEVSCGAERYALKWYFKGSATDEQKKNLARLIEKGSPTQETKQDMFLWPKDLIDDKKEESFGYVMELRPSCYKGIVDLMKCRTNPKFLNLVRACYNITKGYLKLHEQGYQYRDISFGNVFFDPDSGNVKICDNDNVTPNGVREGGIKGTPRFMAPEIVRGEECPSRNTDRFSLAVLLFYMLMVSHPLEGSAEAAIRCMDPAAMTRLYGTDPVFIYDPEDDSNRPVPGYQQNAIVFWKLYPQYIRDLFTLSFTVGLSLPARRITENQWLEAFAKLLGAIVHCPYCGRENFYDESNESGKQNCWCCHKPVVIGSLIVIGKGKKQIRIPIRSGTRIYSHHINGDFDMNTVAGEVVVNPKDASKWGLRNLTDTNWTYMRSDGTHVAVAEGKAATIARHVTIDFGMVSGTFV